MRQDWTRETIPVMRRFLLAIGVITLACSAAFPQRLSRESAGITRPVRIVRIEGRGARGWGAFGRARPYRRR
jgi:hypothetical protein